MPELLQRAGDAKLVGVPPVPVSHSVRVPRLTACRVGREREGIIRHLDAKCPGFGATAPEPVLEQSAGQQVQGQNASLSVFRRLLDVVTILDKVVADETRLMAGEVEPVLAQGTRRAAIVNAVQRYEPNSSSWAQTRLSRWAAWSGVGGSGSRLPGCGGRAFFATLRSAQS